MAKNPEEQAVPDHMGIWSQVCQTDPNFTKHVQKNRQYSFTTINAVYQFEQATRLWGPYGEGAWYLACEKERYTMGKELVVLHARFVYPGGAFDLTNAAKLNGKYGPDDEVFKKLETDTITKALSRLGFGADIFQGQWDGQRYAYDQHEQQHQQQQQPQNQGYPQNHG